MYEKFPKVIISFNLSNFQTPYMLCGPLIHSIKEVHARIQTLNKSLFKKIILPNNLFISTFSGTKTYEKCQKVLIDWLINDWFEWLILTNFWTTYALYGPYNIKEAHEELKICNLPKASINLNTIVISISSFPAFVM